MREFKLVHNNISIVERELDHVGHIVQMEHKAKWPLLVHKRLVHRKRSKLSKSCRKIVQPIQTSGTKANRQTTNRLTVTSATGRM